ncbi:alpha-1,3-mannosyl-glycoprotein 2-beta-N-acetylglucosaminyltransferase [Sitodiplosis mosellana]|uniref:alpha-1,3-mannosyl-glycoprotein 2-beta-N-acetylglucosaminyltransferase n=1 Tax=Sitodiplosis mosellana TaxID=263140 RepID=UPI002445313D|nr:alpha-1,3-mannosyl-glycoprotein 2-beta-N-acetylglucosaminyltransferase [Sitodiplosis mosellana]
MRTKKPFLIALFLCAWTIVSYYLLIRQTDSSNGSNHQTATGTVDARRHRDSLLRQLDRLESNIEEENVIHDVMVKKLIEIIRLKDKKDGAAIAAKVTQLKNVTTKHSNGIDVILVEAKPHPNAIDSLDAPDILDNEIKASNTETELNDIDAPIINRLKELNQRKHDFKGPIIPVVVFACNRISVSNCLDDLVQYRTSAEQFPIIVSQDCNDEPTKKVIESYKDITFMRHPDQSDIFVLPKEKKFKGYYKIARHYGWALNTTFKAGFEYVIIVEDDLNVSPDFFEYFMGTHELLKNDSSLWCVSAWNDNGKSNNIDVSSPELLYRTDFFPGLGWMLTKNLWTELSPKWPKAFWDDWIRQPQQRKERACIRPEISRTRTFGKIGVSNGMFFDKHLRYIKLNEQMVKFTKMNLTHLLKQNYDKQFLNHVYSCPVLTFEEVRRGLVSVKGPVRIQYNTKDQYKRTAKLLGLMDDFKSGVPRTGYLGIVSFYYNNQRVYLAPSSNWRGYDLSWS